MVYRTWSLLPPHHAGQGSRSRLSPSQVTRLTPAQFAAVTNLEFLGVPVFKRTRAGGLFFGRKRKRNVRKVRGSCVQAASPASHGGMSGLYLHPVRCGLHRSDGRC